MPDYEVPEGYAPYRLFTYKDPARAFSVRPDACEGACVTSTRYVQGNTWTLHVAMRNEGHLQIMFGVEEAAARRCHKQLVAFIEQDAMRHVHNGLSKKARTNAG